MPKILDFTNQQFGCIIALESTNQKDNNGSIIWKCKCVKCNSEHYLSTKKLRNQKFINCSKCESKEEIGKIYEELIVEEYYPTSKAGKHWKCRCSCGNVVIVPTKTLHSGRKKSCGCLQKKVASESYIDMTGQIIGRWKVLSKSNNSTNSRHVKWLCECSCEKHTQREIDGAQLRRGATLSCGCLRMSHGEYKISQLLNNANIPYETEKKFETCKFSNGNYARFDFWVNNNYIIEFDGIQHFQETNYFENNLEENQEKDSYKNQWCKKNNIPLIRIPYTKLSDLKLEDLLLESSQFII